MRSIKDDNGQLQIVFDEPVLCYPIRVTKITKVGMTARNTLEAILLVMDTDNNFKTEEKILMYIQKILNEHMEIEYTIAGIRNAISELNKAEIIFREGNQNYYVNPDLYMQFHPEAQKNNLRLSLYKMGVYKISDDRAQL